MDVHAGAERAAGPGEDDRPDAFFLMQVARAWPICVSIARVSAFRRSGRLSTIVPTAPVTFTSTALLCMNIGTQ